MLNSVTLTRSRRPGAGSRMARLLNEEEEDEFYTSTYGGFTEEADDVDYESESSVQDSVDSDFVETEDEGEDNSAAGSDDEGEKQRRTRRVVTKSYKEPKARKKEATTEKTKTESAAPTGRAQASKTKSVSLEKPEEPASEGRQLRASTTRSTAETTAAQRSSATSEVAAIRRKALMAEIAQRKNVPEVRRLTQEELLAEAKITEEINKRSLARYQRLEIERKKNRVHKTVNQLPMIRIHHFAVPSVADQPEVYGAAVNSESGEVELCQMLVDREAKCSRTLVTFTDPASFAAAFPSAAAAAASRQQQMTSKQPGRPRKRTRYCPLTGRLARYVDPLTRTPYADLAAFRALRYLYRLHLETGTPAIDLLRQYRTGQLRVPEA